jgi:hypothetical protein
LPSRSWASKITLDLLGVAILAATATLYAHGTTIGYGFHYDDYYFLRPQAWEDVRESFHGPWDLTGVMVKFYRPLTVAFSALRFELFGLNAVAHHTTSLVLFAVAATLTAWLIHRATGRRAAGVLAAVFFTAHPVMPYSLVAWITNQMHLLQMLTVLAALMWWQVARARGLGWWTPLLGVAAASFLIKEDGVMLLPAIVVLHEIQRRTVDPTVPRVPIPFIAAAALTIAGLMLWRNHVLGELGGYTRLSFDKAWANLAGTLVGVYRLVPADRPWQPLASWFATVLPLAGLVAWPWVSRPARFCLAAGASIAVLFALPFIFVAKPEQVYLLGLGLSIVLAGASLALVDLAVRAPLPRVAVAAVVIVVGGGLAAFVAVTRDITRDFEPFGPIVLVNDDIVRTWGFVPVEIKEYLERKRVADAARHLSPNVLDELTVATFNTHGRDVTPDGVPYMWMARPWCEIDIAANARQVTIPLRHEIGIFRDPARVRVLLNGRLVDELELTTPEWKMSTVAVVKAHLPAFSRMHRLHIVIDRVWIPSRIIPGSTDDRPLGLQIGTVEIR